MKLIKIINILLAIQIKKESKEFYNELFKQTEEFVKRMIKVLF